MEDFPDNSVKEKMFKLFLKKKKNTRTKSKIQEAKGDPLVITFQAQTNSLCIHCT